MIQSRRFHYDPPVPVNIISLDGVSKTLKDVPLFSGVTLGIDAGERIGFVGRNGSGKSTFLRIVSGELEPDEGTISKNRALTMAVVEQRPLFRPEMNLEEFGGEAQGAGGVGAADRYRSYCRELGLRDLSLPMGSLSGGMTRKASIARCLAQGAGFLLLDEPTNHLDLDTIEWLEALLASAQFGFIMVTHDRYFLDAVCTSVMEIENGTILKYTGNYDVYLEKKAERIEQAARTEQRRLSVLRGELEWLKRGPRARTGKDKGRKERIKELQAAAPGREAGLQGFSSAHRRLGGKVLELHGVSKSYGGEPVVRAFSYSFRRGERIGVIGPNGSGKTTFLRLLCGEITPDSGEAVKGDSTVFGHFDQTGSAIDGSLTVIGFMKELAEVVRGERGESLSAEQFLERFLFPRDVQGIRLERLSGGELRRLTLVRLLAAAPNFLLLDEPTNDLDLDTTRLLEEYLTGFTGCMIVVSHDRAMLDRITDTLLVFDGAGGITSFTGSYDDWRLLRQAEAEARDTEKPRAESARRQAPREKKPGLSFKERQEHDRLLEEISALEDEKKALEAAFQSTDRSPAQIQKDHVRYREVESLMAEKTERWEELAGRA